LGKSFSKKIRFNEIISDPQTILFNLQATKKMKAFSEFDNDLDMDSDSDNVSEGSDFDEDLDPDKIEVPGNYNVLIINLCKRLICET